MAISFPELNLIKCSNEQAFINLFDTHKKSLTSRWLGRKCTVIKAKQLYQKSLCQEAFALNLFEKSLVSGAKADHIWAFWKDLFSHQICSRGEFGSIHTWKQIKVKEEPSDFALLFYKVAAFARMVFRVIGYYFGFDPRYVFAAKSFWDFEQRFVSFQRLACLLITASMGAYQASVISSAFFKMKVIQISIWSKVAIVSSVALVVIVALGWGLYSLGKWFGGAPLELQKCRNITFEMSLLDKPRALGREKEVAQLIGHFTSVQSSIVMIEGAAGSGKTELLMEFTRVIGKDPIPSGMKKMQVFLLNAAQLQASSFTSSIEHLNSIKEQMEGYEKEIILAIDECHLLNKECLEQLKEWKDQGLKLILLTNASKEVMKKNWSETYESLVSHTRSSTINLENSSRELLELLMNEWLFEKPELYLECAAKEALLDSFKGKDGAPRLLKLALETMWQKEISYQKHQENILKSSQEIDSFQTKLSVLIKKGDWQEFNAKASDLEKKIASRQLLLNEVKQREEAIQTRKENIKAMEKLKQKLSFWAKGQSLKTGQSESEQKQDKRFLSSVQQTFFKISSSQKLSFASVWTKQRVCHFLKAESTGV